MGIYDGGIPSFDFRLDMDKDKIVAYAGIAIGIILIILVAYWLVLNFDSSPVDISFEKNPIAAGESTRVKVIVTNRFDIDAQNVGITLRAKEQRDFDVVPLNDKFNGTIPLVSAGASREVTYLVNPVGEILPGTYTLVATVVIENEPFVKEAKLIIQGRN